MSACKQLLRNYQLALDYPVSSLSECSALNHCRLAYRLMAEEIEQVKHAFMAVVNSYNLSADNRLVDHLEALVETVAVICARGGALLANVKHGEPDGSGEMSERNRGGAISL